VKNGEKREVTMKEVT